VGQVSNTIGRITPAGKMAGFERRIARDWPLCVTPDKEGKIWFTAFYGAAGYLVLKAGTCSL
jgi:hypothetical protein